MSTLNRVKESASIESNEEGDNLPSDIRPYAVDNTGNRWSVEGPIEPTSYFTNALDQFGLYQSLQAFEETILQLKRIDSDGRMLCSDLYDDVTQENLDTMSLSDFSDVRSELKPEHRWLNRSLSFTSMEISPYEQFEKETGKDFLKTIVEKSGYPVFQLNSSQKTAWKI